MFSWCDHRQKQRHPSLKPKVNVLGHRVTAGKLANSDGRFPLIEFLAVNAHTTEVGSGLSFAQKLASLPSAPTSIPEGCNQPMFGFHITTYAGRARQDNTFRRSWAKFYADNRLRTISGLIEEAQVLMISSAIGLRRRLPLCCRNYSGMIT